MKNTISLIKDTIIKINQTKKLVVDYYKLSSNVSDMDLSSEYLFECECKMDECGDLIETIYNLLAEINIIDDMEQLEYLKNEFNFVPFDNAIIWSYL